MQLQDNLYVNHRELEQHTEIYVDIDFILGHTPDDTPISPHDDKLSKQQQFEDLIEREISLEHNNLIPLSGTAFCPNLEERHQAILHKGCPYWRKGYVIILNELPIGYVKWHGDRTFMAWHTVKSNQEYPIIFSGAYQITDKLRKELEDIPLIHGRWGIKKLDYLILNPGRKIGLDWKNAQRDQEIINNLKKEREIFMKEYV